jgi:hypothetical protein
MEAVTMGVDTLFVVLPLVTAAVIAAMAIIGHGRIG